MAPGKARVMMPDEGLNVNVKHSNRTHIGEGSSTTRDFVTEDFISTLVDYATQSTWYEDEYRKKVAKLSQIAKIRGLIHNGADVKACDSDSVSALIMALKGWVSSLRWDWDSDLEIHQAATEIVREILVRGADPNIQDQDGRTPLHIVMVDGRSSINRRECTDISLIQQLVKAGAHIDPPPDLEITWPTTPLIEAVENSRLDVIKLLISLGANVSTTIGNNTALLTAIRGGDELFPNRVTNILATLLDHEVDVKTQEQRILSSAISHSPESVERLLSERFDYDNAPKISIYRAPELDPSETLPYLPPPLSISTSVIKHHGTTEQLCRACRAFEKEAVYRKWFRHSEDSDAVYQSISAGCGMCQLIKDCLPESFGVVSLYYYSALAEADTLSRDYFERIIVRGQLWSEALQHGELRWEESHQYGELRLAAVQDDTANLLSRVSGLDDQRTDSESSFQLAAHWINTCIKHHGGACGSASHFLNGSIPVLPTRVIDVGLSDGSEEPRLLISNGQEAHYITLSYCWGDKANLCTESNTLESFQTSIPFDRAPKTIQEAILTSRRLGIRYLWVDTLCILQDSLEDWLREAKNIAGVYRNSLLTIAAADSVDSEGGLFRAKKRSRTRPVKLAPRLADHIGDLETLYAFGDRQESNDGFRPDSRLDERGWVLQEQLLSPRTLNFSSQELYWDCPSLSASESYPEGIPRDHDHNFERRYFTELKTKIRGPRHSAHQERVHMLWQHMITLYTKRKLSVQTDKLLALAGAAHQVSLVLDDQLLAGLWVKWLWRDLLWWVDSPKEIEPPLPISEAQNVKVPVPIKTIEKHVVSGSSGQFYRTVGTVHEDFQAPSWSWASVQAPISDDFPQGTSYLRYYPCLQILDHKENILPDTKGVSATITLRGVLLPAKIHPESNEWAILNWEPNPQKARRFWPSIWKKPDDLDAALHWKPDSEEEFVGENILCLVVAASHQFVVGLGVVPTGQGQDEYRRVGLVYWSSLHYPVPEEVEFRVLTIV